MKSILIILLLVSVISQTCFAQEAATAPMTRADYLHKAKGQKTGAWILLGAGVGSILAVSSGNSSFNTLAAFGIVGGAAIISSVPLFLAAGRNKRKGMAMVYFNMENNPANRYMAGNTRYIPALSVKLNL